MCMHVCYAFCCCCNVVSAAAGPQRHVHMWCQAVSVLLQGGCVVIIDGVHYVQALYHQASRKTSRQHPYERSGACPQRCEDRLQNRQVKFADPMHRILRLPNKTNCTCADAVQGWHSHHLHCRPQADSSVKHPACLSDSRAYVQSLALAPTQTKTSQWSI